ncbi:hypothetical protein [Nodularia sp. NIES-3585]|uniref:hypothetical protein n=1 Tax=Nodularia sp. NIES-3585 TaxID=1973477 RepID=UPI000B5CDC5C|nr:hypothetical protein [Nodularia sp. NIES-3585]GAX36961.1 hypothetical protein NIES3585_30000 [Nodularia sp. NIES-3585]
MDQNSLIASETKLSQTSGLKPPLAAALASLEVPIDKELARYRRRRIGVRIQNQSRMGRYIHTQSPDLLDHPVTEGKVTPTSEDNQTLTTPGFILHETPQENLVSTNVQLDDFNLLSDSESIKPQIPQSSRNSASSIVPAGVEANQNQTPETDYSSPPDDYLESSEALLRGLTEAQSDPEELNKSNDSLLSPVGIGSMLLLLVASLTLGYVVFNPNSQGWTGFNLSRLFKTDSSLNSEENPEKVASNTQSEPELTSIPKYPNLAAKEFPQVRNPTDVVGLQPKVQPKPSPIITPDVQSLPKLQPVPPVDLPSNSRAETLSEERTTALNANAELKPAADGFYHIVTDNQGDRALSTAQKVVPDAYLSPKQTLIYLAAVKTQDAAQEKLQMLQSQGIKARIQQD